VSGQHQKNSKKIRLIGCQGTIQFLTAVSVSEQLTNNNCEVHLLVYDLASPAGQDQAFFRFIERMAHDGPAKFTSIKYLPPPLFEDLIRTHDEEGMDQLRLKVIQATGLAFCNEILVSTNWQWGNMLLMNVYHDAKKICFGDSIGVHIPEGYFANINWTSSLKKIPGVNNLVTAAKNARLGMRYRRRPAFSAVRPIPFDIGYYYTLEMTDTKPMWPTVMTSSEKLLGVFKQYSATLPFELSEWDGFLTDVTIVMTSNFSEAGKMTIEHEVEAYVRFVTETIQKSASVVIKPHPRDSMQKLEWLRRELSKSVHVKLLSQLDDYFTPFELLLLRLLSVNPKLQQATFVSFSSACLSLKYVFDINPVVGFGNTLVKKYFLPQAITPRIEHEQDLERLLMIDAAQKPTA
jgi:hypothetical protein